MPDSGQIGKSIIAAAPVSAPNTTGRLLRRVLEFAIEGSEQLPGARIAAGHQRGTEARAFLAAGDAHADEDARERRRLDDPGQLVCRGQSVERGQRDRPVVVGVPRPDHHGP